MTLLGFTVDGVLALSFAAMCQSYYYGAATGSTNVKVYVKSLFFSSGGCFSIAQSIGAVGFSPPVIIANASIGGFLGAYIGWNMYTETTI